MDFLSCFRGSLPIGAQELALQVTPVIGSRLDAEAGWQLRGRVRYHLSPTPAAIQLGTRFATEAPFPAERVLVASDPAVAQLRAECNGPARVSVGARSPAGEFSLDMVPTADVLAFAPDHRVHVFDGGRMRVLDASARLVNDSPLQPDFYDMGDSRSGRWFFVDLEYPVLFAHGIVPLNGTLDLRHLRVDAATLDLHVHGRGLVDGRECMILRTPAISRPDSFDLSVAVYRDSFHELWVDLERESAVVRWYNYTVGRLGQYAEIAYDDTADGWLPERWIHTTWHYPDGDTRILYSARLRVTERTINEALPASLFELEPRAGMRVEARRGEDLYRIGDDGESRIDIPLPWEEREASGPPWVWIVAIALGAAAATLTWRVIMARKRRASPPGDSTGNAVP